MAIDFENVTKSMPALFTYTRADGNIVCHVINKGMCVLPYWVYQDIEIFNPMTPASARAMMFNVVVGAKFTEGRRTYARKITFHKDDKFGPFLCLDLTAVGVQMACKESNSTSKKGPKSKALYDPCANDAPYLWGTFRHQLRRALTQLNLEPINFSVS